MGSTSIRALRENSSLPSPSHPSHPVPAPPRPAPTPPHQSPPLPSSHLPSPPLPSMDSQSVNVRENVHALWWSRAWQGLDGSDQELLKHTLREVGMHMLVLPAVRAAPME